MKFYTFEIVIEKEAEDPGFAAYSPTLPGRFGAGAAIEEAKKDIRLAVERRIASLLAHGDPIPHLS